MNVHEEPLVCAILLTKDRPGMVARAVRAFRAQTYPNKCLLVWDSGTFVADLGVADLGRPQAGEMFWGDSYTGTKSIGELRNAAVRFAVGGPTPHPEIFIHFDDDDLSHPSRIAEQVAHLQSSGADVVGFNELLFWREASIASGEAWLYRNVRADLCPGTTLCYWRKTWERKPFPDTSEAEDRKFCMGLNCAAAPSFWIRKDQKTEPRMIASIHGENTANYDLEGLIARGGDTNWKRVPEFDSYCAETMRL